MGKHLSSGRVEAREEKVRPNTAHFSATSSHAIQRRMVPISDVKVDPSLMRQINQSLVEKLAKMIAAFGLRHPITVTTDLQLVAGAKWFAAARMLGWVNVEVVVVENEP